MSRSTLPAVIGLSIMLIALACSPGRKESAPAAPKPSTNQPEKPTPPQPAPEPELPENFTFVEDEIILKKCIDCHREGNDRNHGVDLSSYQAIVNSNLFPPLIIPGNPEESSFYESVKKGRMPKGPQKLSERELEGVFKWIKAGAKDREGSPPPQREEPSEPPSSSCEPDEPGCD